MGAETELQRSHRVELNKSSEQIAFMPPPGFLVATAGGENRANRMQKLYRLFVVRMILLVFLSAAISAQQTTPLRIEDLLATREFAESSTAQFSPDDQWVVYTMRDNRRHPAISYDVREYRSTGVVSFGKAADICVTHTKTGEVRNLTGGEGDNWSPAWSPDGRYLAFLSDRDQSGQAKLWLWDTQGDVLRKASDLILRSQDVRWLPDSKAVLVGSLPENMSPADYLANLSTDQQAMQLAETKALGSTAVVYKSPSLAEARALVPTSDPWNLDQYVRDLSIVNVETGDVHRLVKGQRIAKYSPSPDGSMVAFTSPQRFEMPGSQQVLWDVKLISLATAAERVLAHEIRLGYEGASFSWSPDTSQLAYQTAGKNSDQDCFVVEVKGGIPRNLTIFHDKPLHSKPAAPLWNATGDSVYFIRSGVVWKAAVHQAKPLELAEIPGHRVLELPARGADSIWSSDGGRTTVVLTFDIQCKDYGFYRLDLSLGRATKLLEGHQCYACRNANEFMFGASRTDQITYFSQDAQHAVDLWITDSSFFNRRRLTHLNPQLDSHPMAEARLIDWNSLDGDRLQGALLLPVGFQQNKRYPLLVWAYGNQYLSDNLNQFGLGYGPLFNFQLFATQGYAVLLPDAPQQIGTPMMDLTKTILPAVDKVVEMGVADPARLAIMGQSYGAYCALAMMVQTKRFKASIMVDGFGDLTAAYGQMQKDGSAFQTSITEQGQGLMGGTPWQFRDRYIENSPFFYLNRVETPLLIVHGTEDTTVAPFLSDELFVALRRLGREVEYVKYDGEGHSPIYWRSANQIDLWARVIGWLDGHLKGSTSAPGN